MGRRTPTAEHELRARSPLEGSACGISGAAGPDGNAGLLVR